MVVTRNICPKCQSEIRFLKHSITCKCGSKFRRRIQ